MANGLSPTFRRVALLPAASMVLAWVPIFIRLAAEGGAPALIIAFDRMMIAAVALTLYVVIFRRDALASFSGRALIAAVFAGIFFGGFNDVFSHYSVPDIPLIFKKVVKFEGFFAFRVFFKKFRYYFIPQ